MSRFDFSKITVEYKEAFQGFYSRVPAHSQDVKVYRTRRGDGKFEDHEPFSWADLRGALIEDGFIMTKRLSLNKGVLASSRTIREWWSKDRMGTVVVPVQEQGVRCYGA